MRARLAISSTGMQVELREVVLRNKPDEMLVASPKATVPVLVLDNGTVIDESLDVMLWAFQQDDREGLRDAPADRLEEMDQLVSKNDGPFKSALDRYKYPNRYEDVDRLEQRKIGADFIRALDTRLADQAFLFGNTFSFADAAILPFVRQFAHVDRDWFWGEHWKNVIRWLEAFIESDRFQAIMTKYDAWATGDEITIFGSHT